MGYRAQILLLALPEASMELVQAWQGKSPGISSDHKADRRPGQDFFNGWTFFTEPDPTKGSVNYVNQATALSDHLVSFTERDTIIMRVDNITVLGSGKKRNSVRIESQRFFEMGQLLVLDAVHMPTGCGTWPAFWTTGPGNPNGGELDIVEGVNTQTQNIVSIHSAPGKCDMPKKNIGTSLQEGNGDCGARGCALRDTSKQSFGPGFNDNGGGVFATLWQESGIKMWFFGRDDIPADLASGKSPDTATWGTPGVVLESSTCNTASAFIEQTIIFSMPLCGTYAGDPEEFKRAGCPGQCADMIADAANWHDAYWEVSYVKIFS